jgi:hypothetical protein
MTIVATLERTKTTFAERLSFGRKEMAGGSQKQQSGSMI